MAPRAAADKEKAAKKTDEAVSETAEEKAPQMTQSDVIQNYRRVYDRCMEGETKTFDAKGALSALDQISKLLGLDTPIKAADIEGNRVILTLSDKVGERGD